MATVMIMPVHIPVLKMSPITSQPDIRDNNGAKNAVLKCLLICAPDQKWWIPLSVAESHSVYQTRFNGRNADLLNWLMVSIDAALLFVWYHNLQ
jgi:hypothetical protein